MRSRDAYPFASRDRSRALRKCARTQRVRGSEGERQRGSEGENETEREKGSERLDAKAFARTGRTR